MPVVRDLMTESVLTLTKDTPLSDAATTLSNMGVSGAPVCDESGRPVGVFSKSDVVTTLVGEGPGGDPRVGSLMTPIVFAVKASDLLDTAIRLMVAESVHRLMVVDAEGKVIGILTPMDVLKAIVSGKLKVEGVEG